MQDHPYLAETAVKGNREVLKHLRHHLVPEWIKEEENQFLVRKFIVRGIHVERFHFTASYFLVLANISGRLLVKFGAQFNAVNALKPMAGREQQHSSLARTEINKRIFIRAFQREVSQDPARTLRSNRDVMEIQAILDQAPFALLFEVRGSVHAAGPVKPPVLDDHAEVNQALGAGHFLNREPQIDGIHEDMSRYWTALEFSRKGFLERKRNLTSLSSLASRVERTAVYRPLTDPPNPE